MVYSEQANISSLMPPVVRVSKVAQASSSTSKERKIKKGGDVGKVAKGGGEGGAASKMGVEMTVEVLLEGTDVDSSIGLEEGRRGGKEEVIVEEKDEEGVGEGGCGRGW